jgi:starch synthase
MHHSPIAAVRGDRVAVKVLSVTSELYPLVKTGGLADVTGSLPKALAAYGIETRSLLPGYPAVLDAIGKGRRVAELDLLGYRARLISTRVDGHALYILDVPELYQRRGGPYLDEDGVDFADNSIRFAVLSLAGARIASGAVPGWRPDLVHTHDWQSALTSVYMRYVMESAVPTVLTIHNLAFQGQFALRGLPDLELPSEAYTIDCLEYYGDVSFLKGGIQTADMVTTVSPTYAREILSEGLGMGMDGVLKARRRSLRGIVNGIDTDVWSPDKDPHLICAFGPGKLARRGLNRKHLTNRFGLADSDGPIFSVVSRLTWQKGIDLLLECVPHIVDGGGRLIVCGQGDHGCEQQLREMARLYPNHVAVSIGYDEALAHLIHGGTDFIVQPSRFEPCGLTQLYALRYGAVPIVARTGGLSETIIDANDAAMAAEAATGIQFHPTTAEELCHAIDRAMALFRDPDRFAQLQVQGMKMNFSWETSALQYASLYEELTGSLCPEQPWHGKKAS